GGGSSVAAASRQPMTRPPDCPELSVLRDFAAGLLPGTDPGAVRLHLAGCPACRDALEALRTPSEPTGGTRLPEGPREQLTVGIRGKAAQEAPEEEDSLPELRFLQPSANPRALGRLGNHDVLEFLGRGGMGVVLKAFDTSLHRTVAIKILSPELAASRKAQRRF